MKQYLDKDQTAKLIELGFPEPLPKYIHIGGVSYDSNHSYSIGELIEFLCPHFQATNYKLTLQKIQEISWIVEVEGVNYDELDFQTNQELIDALFCACVTLKEEGVI